MADTSKHPSTWAKELAKSIPVPEVDQMSVVPVNWEEHYSNIARLLDKVNDLIVDRVYREKATK